MRVIYTLAIANYRSLREVVLPLGQLTVITGANGSGKSNLYRALRLLSDTSIGGAVPSLAREGGIKLAVWAGPETVVKATKEGRQEVQGGPRKKPVSIKLGFAADDFSYSVEFGLPVLSSSAFAHDPEIKREAIWYGDKWRASATLVDRKAGLVRVKDDDGHWSSVIDTLAMYDSMLTEIADPTSCPEVLLLRDRIRSWRFYDSFRTDESAPARLAHVGTRTPVLFHDGRDLAAALQTIIEIGDADALAQGVEDAFPGAQLWVEFEDGRLQVAFKQYGLLRALSQAELSDGTLRYLLLMAALLTPRPPELMVLNEPETSLHPDLVPALARLILQARESSQVWVVTHSDLLTDLLTEDSECQLIRLDKELGETRVQGQDLLNTPVWHWPVR
jgi:predicted ATPase